MKAGRPLRGPDPEGGGFAAAHLHHRAAAPGSGDAPRQGTGPPLRPPGCCAPLRGGLRPAWTPETSAAPQAGNTGRPSLPLPGGRGASGDHRAPAYQRTPGNEVNWRSIVTRTGEITRMGYEEVSTV